MISSIPSHTRTRALLGTLDRYPDRNPDIENNDYISGYPAGFPSERQPHPPSDHTPHIQNVGAGGGWTDVFCRVFKRQPDELCRSDVTFYLNRGMTEEVIKLAICAARDAKIPTWKYSVTVMRNCLRERILEMDGFLERSEAHYKQRARLDTPTHESLAPKYQPTVPAQMYTQRDYTREELYALFEVI